jgi:hypothetical protein
MLLVVVVAACGSTTPSSAAAGACVADGRAPGVYPELERLVGERWHQVSPGAFATMAPTTIDSGRNCSATALGTLVSHGVTELHFAGATWDEGDGNAMVSAILAVPDGAPPLAAAWIEEFYEAGARAGKHTENIETSRPTMGSVGPVYRLDTLNDLSLQTVVVWPAAEGIRVVIVTTNVRPDSSRAEHDRRVVEGVEGRSPQPSSS